MQLRELDSFLEHLAHALRSMEAPKAVKHLGELRSAFAPFLDQSVADFVSFLGKCTEYQRTGLIPQKDGRKKAAAVDPQSVNSVVARTRDVLNRIRSDDVTYAVLEELVKEINRLKQPEVNAVASELGVGAAKTKKTTVESIRSFLHNQKQAAEGARF